MSTCKFIHLRCYDEVTDDNLNGTNQPLPHGGATIVYREAENKDKIVLEVAFSRCHYNDNFNRKIGRDVAVGHLLSGNFDYLEIEPDQVDGLFDLVVEFVNNKCIQLDAQHELLMEQRQGNVTIH